MKKFASLILALALSLALCVPAFAAETDIVTEQVYDLGNGITVIVGLDDEAWKMPRTDIYEHSTTNRDKTQPYNMLASEGNICRAHIWNNSNNTELKVTFDALVNGSKVTSKTVTITTSTAPAYIEVKGNSDSGLTGYIHALLSPVDGASINYTYSFRQFWD